MSAPIPPYSDPNHAAPSSATETASNPPANDSESDAAPPELPPAYAVVDEKATSFAIYGTFIWTPNGPAYQLSSLLDACISRLRIRRLRAEEVTFIQSGGAHLPFDNATTLYEAHDPPFLVNEYYIQGKQGSCLPGVLQLRFGLRRWHVRHMAHEGAKAEDIMACGKSGGLGRALRQRKNEMEPSEWKDSGGSVMATEVLKMENGGKLPTIELREGLDQTCRELLLTMWVARLWAAFGAGSQSMYMA